MIISNLFLGLSLSRRVKKLLSTSSSSHSTSILINILLLDAD